MVESGEVGSSNSMRLSPTGTIARRTFSDSTVFFGHHLQPELLVKLLGLGQRLHGNSQMIDLAHDAFPNLADNLFHQRIRVALVLGNFGSIALASPSLR